jgi:formamidopyrimidine-DNA glycosylase
VNLSGLGGTYQDHFRVYEREVKKCFRNDGGIIKKIKLGGRGTYFCEVCQK